jgi:hypothetical protein
MIDEASNAISTPDPIKIISNAVEVHILEVSSSFRNCPHTHIAAQSKKHLSNVSATLETTDKKPPLKTSRRQRIPQPQTRRQSGSSHSSDRKSNEASASDSKDKSIVKYLWDATSSDPDPYYVSEWRFFLASKGKTLNDANLIRTYTFAVDFIKKWQDERVDIEVPSIYSRAVPTKSLIVGVRPVSHSPATYLPGPQAESKLVRAGS